MTGLDWIALGVAGLAAVGGLARGLVWSALSLSGLVAGAVLGGRLAPELLAHGSRSPYAPLAALGGAVAVAALLEAVANVLGSSPPGSPRIRSLRPLDPGGGRVARAVPGRASVR